MSTQPSEFPSAPPSGAPGAEAPPLTVRRRALRNLLMRPIEILLVEDNEGDVRLTREALAEAKVRNHLAVARDGAEALEYLRRPAAPGGDAPPRPDLILLDLNLPKKDGREVLAELKQDPKLRRLPVVVLTTSSSEKDILESYDLHANCYITKPVDLDQFIHVVTQIEDFWLTIVKLPSQPAAG